MKVTLYFHLDGTEELAVQPKRLDEIMNLLRQFSDHLQDRIYLDSFERIRKNLFTKDDVDSLCNYIKILAERALRKAEEAEEQAKNYNVQNSLLKQLGRTYRSSAQTAVRMVQMYNIAFNSAAIKALEHNYNWKGEPRSKQLELVK